MTQEIQIHRDDLTKILDFMKCYPGSEYVVVKSNSSSGIGSIITASVRTVQHGDHVTVTKDIVDESSW